MSTSASPARMQQIEQPPADFQAFPYEGVAAATPVFPERLGSAAERTAAEMESRVAASLAQGRREGESAARKVFQEELQKERSAIASALAQFSRDRAAYFQTVEGEVVQLSLAIARKILHREAQVDPLLLAGVVRVALEQIEGATGVVLRVHPQNSTDWRGYLASNLAPSALPEIVEDSALPLSECTLETSMGSAQLGVDVQLKEIEQGMMDLLAVRPGARQ
jgi:flagellar assembly protein FliH